MGRRKKESESTHRTNIAMAAERLFLQAGTASATMNDIAKEAGYSKATLYVYFADKEEIIAFLVLRSMKRLYAYLSEAVEGSAATKDKYRRLCQALVDYQEQYPLYFVLALEEINVDFEKKEYLPVEKETFEVGEQINHKIGEFINEGIHAGDIRPDTPILQTVFLFWAALSGVIQMSVKKQMYLENFMGVSRQQFLEDGFERLYRIISD